VLRYEQEETPCRGSVDQDPIILESSFDNHENYSTPCACSSTSNKGSSIHTKKVAYDQRPSQVRGRQPSPTKEQRQPEILDTSRRGPSPYAYTATPSSSTAKHTSFDSAYYSSSETRPTIVKPSIASSTKKDVPNVTRRTSGLKELDPNRRLEKESRSHDALETKPVAVPTERRSARYSSSGRDVQESVSRSPSVSKPAATSSASSNDQTLRTVLAGVASLGLAGVAAQLGTSSHRNERTPPSHSASPSAFRPHRDSPPLSRHSSGRNSGSNSRPSSPVGGHSRYDESTRRSTTFPQVTVPANHPPSRLATASFPPAEYHSRPAIDMPTMPSFGSSYRASASSSVPYPTTGTALMPSEHDFSPRNTQHEFTSRSFVPPTLHSSQTYPLSSNDPRPAPHHHRTASSSTYTSTRPPRSLSPPRFGSCSRTRPGHFDDWITFRSARCANICPTCYASTLGSSIDLRPHCITVSRDPRARLTCDLSTPWMRLALLLTHAHSDPRDTTPDLRRVLQLAHVVATTAPCPGGEYKAQRWFTLRHRGRRLHGFNVCAADVARVEALVPCTRGLWEEAKSSGKERRCELREGSGRFAVLLDGLVQVERGSGGGRRGQGAELDRFVEVWEDS